MALWLYGFMAFSIERGSGQRALEGKERIKQRT